MSSYFYIAFDIFDGIMKKCCTWE